MHREAGAPALQMSSPSSGGVGVVVKVWVPVLTGLAIVCAFVWWVAQGKVVTRDEWETHTRTEAISQSALTTTLQQINITLSRQGDVLDDIQRRTTRVETKLEGAPR